MPIGPVGQSACVVIVDKGGHAIGCSSHCSFHCCDASLVFGICRRVGCRDDVGAVSLDQLLYRGSQNAPWAHLFLYLAQSHLGRFDLEANIASLKVGLFSVSFGESNPDVDASVWCSLVTSPCHRYRRDFSVSQAGDAKTRDEASKIGVGQICDISGGDFEKLLNAWRCRLALFRTSSSGLPAGHLEVAAVFQCAHVLLRRTSRRETTGSGDLFKRGWSAIRLNSGLDECQYFTPAVV